MTGSERDAAGGDAHRPAAQGLVTYYLAWRTRPNHPWRSEELHGRTAAQQRYFALLERGVEAYLELRRPASLPV